MNFSDFSKWWIVHRGHVRGAYFCGLAKLKGASVADTPEGMGTKTSKRIKSKRSKKKMNNFPKFNSSPLKSYLPNRKGSSSNHHFSGAMLNFGGVTSRNSKNNARFLMVVSIG